MLRARSRGLVKLALTGGSLLACAGVCASAQAAPIGAYTTTGAYSFVSAPILHPPRIATDARGQGGKLAPGDFLVANFPNLLLTEPRKGVGVRMTGQSGPLILDSHLQPVWFEPVPTNVVAMDLKQESYRGKPVLTWWQGGLTSTGAPTSGEVVVVDQHYHKLASVTGRDGWTISEHDAVISGPDVWVTAYRLVPGQNLAPYGGLADGVVYDSAVQEYSLNTNRLLFTWDPLMDEHIPLAQSKQPPASKPGPTGAPIPWDAYHVNSIQLTGNGTFLVSMRNTWAAYLVKKSTGDIEWTLSGNPKVSTFTVPAGASFAWQHDVELHPGNVVSMFDDACCALLPTGKFASASGPSHGLALKLHPTTRKASLLGKYGPLPEGVTGLPGSAFDSQFLGNTELLPGGNVVVGWGSQPFFSEYSKAGKLLFDAFWPRPDLSYRAYVDRWVGAPSQPPGGAASTSNGKTTVYASWNGATRVAGWRVVAGPNPSRLPLVATEGRSGFETVIAVNGSFEWLRVQAVDSKGHVLGTSPAFHPSQPHR